MHFVRTLEDSSWRWSSQPLRHIFPHLDEIFDIDRSTLKAILEIWNLIDLFSKDHPIANLRLQPIFTYWRKAAVTDWSDEKNDSTNQPNTLRNSGFSLRIWYDWPKTKLYQYTRGFGTWSQYKLNKPCSMYVQIHNDIQFPSWHLTCLYSNLTFTFKVPIQNLSSSQMLLEECSNETKKKSTGSNKPSFISNLKWGQPRPTQSTSPKKREKLPTTLGNLGKICPKSLELRPGWSLLAPESSKSSFLATCGYVDSNSN